MPKRTSPRRASPRKPGRLSPAQGPASPKGGSLAGLIGQLRAYEPVEWLRTGIPAIDLVVGAGIPRGRFMEAVGDPATTKTAFAFVVAAAFQRAGGVAIYLDVEAKADREFAEKMGVDFGALAYDRAPTLEECIRVLGRVAKVAAPKVPTVVIWDSIAAAEGVDELDQAISDDGMPAEKASRARYISGGLRATLGQLLGRKNVTLLAINQLRTKLNFYGSRGPLHDSPGGRAVKYHTAVRLMFRNRGRHLDQKSGIVSGIDVEVEAIKNECAPPYRKSTLKFGFDAGFESCSGLAELLIRHGRLEKTAGWLSYRPADGSPERKFRESEIAQVVTEIPELLAPLRGVVEKSS